MSERQYVTELRVDAPTDQITKLNQALKGVESTIKAIRGAGPITPQVGGMGGAPGAVGTGGAGTPVAGGWGAPGPMQGGGGGGGPGWGGGGWWGRGGRQPPGDGGGGGGRTIGQTVNRIGAAIPRTGDAALVGGVTAAASLVGLGALAGGLAADTLRAVDKAIEADRAQSRTRGLTRGRVGAVSGTALGFTPTEAAELTGQAAGAGLGAAGTRDLAGIAMAFERIGIGAGSATNFARAFALGGGAAEGQGAMGRTLATTFGLAVQMGLENAQIPGLLENVGSQITALADRGYDVSAADVLAGITTVSRAGGGAKALEGARTAAVYGNIAELARTVAQGGGTAIQQEVILRAAGLGQIDPATGERIDLVGARMRAARGGAGLTASVIRQMRLAGGGDPRAAAMFGTDVLQLGGLPQTLALAQGGAGGGLDLLAAGALGRQAIAQSAGAATSGLMARTAGIEARDVRLGRSVAGEVLDMREMMQSVRHAAARSVIIPAMKEIITLTKDIGEKGLAEAIKEFIKRRADPAKSGEKPPGSKWDPKRKMWVVPDPKEPPKDAPEPIPGQGGKGWQGDLRGPGGVYRIELSPEASDLFRMIYDPGVPA